MTQPVSDEEQGLDSRPELRPAPLRGWTAVWSVVSVLGLGLVAIVGTRTFPPLYVGVVLGGLGALVLMARWLVRGYVWLAIFVLVVMFIPIRRYALPVPLPIALEPYRIVLVVLIVGVLGALVLHPRFQYRPLKFGWAWGLFAFTMLISITTNSTSLIENGQAEMGVAALVNLLLLFSVFFLVRQLLDGPGRVERLLVLLVWCGVFVAFVAVVERFTHVNYFWRLGDILPLEVINEYSQGGRAGGARAFGSAQHPIALATLFVLLLPVAAYLAKHARRPYNEVTRFALYSGAFLVLLVGVSSAVSRTSVVAMAAGFLLILLVRPYLAIALGLLAMPLLGVAYAVQPKLIDDLLFSFLDINSLIASQYSSPGSAGAGRLADLEPAMEAFRQDPFFGVGFGSRVVVGPEANAFILDNQYLGTMLDAGVIGVFGILVMYLVPVWMLTRLSLRLDVSRQHRDLALALSCSLVTYAAASYLFDAFNFIQAFYVYSMLAAVGAWLLSQYGRQASMPESSALPAGHQPA